MKHLILMLICLAVCFVILCINPILFIAGCLLYFGAYKLLIESRIG